MDETTNTQANTEAAASTADTTAATTETKSTAEAASEKADSALKTISKDYYDKKVSELNGKNKALKAERDSAKTAEQQATDAQVALTERAEAAERELALIKHCNTLVTEGGYDTDTANALATAFVANDLEGFTSIQKAYSEALEARVRKEVQAELVAKTMNVQTAAGGATEKDPHIERAKSIGRVKTANSEHYKATMSAYTHKT